jgi:multidrug resistance efflux pump
VVTRGDLAPRLLLTGELRSGEQVELEAPKTDIWELTIRWMIDDGAAVKAGDRVLEFDNSAFTTGLEEKRVAAVEAASAYDTFLDTSAMANAVKDHELEQHRIALAKATLLASVPSDLLAQRTAQERQLEKTRAGVAVERAEKDAKAERQANALERQVKQIELDKAKRAIATARDGIDKLVLTAPRDGMVLVGIHPWEERQFQLGDTVQPGFAILTLPDLSTPMVVRADLSDVDDGRVAIGMIGTCTLDAYPREALPCKVEELAPVARARGRQSLRRVFALRLSLAQTDPDRMRPGMSVKIELPGEPVKAALLVPRGAIVVDGDAAKVRLASGELRAITLGPCDAQRCAVTAGVTEGEAVQP